MSTGRLTRDHALYAKFCDAVASLRSIATLLNNTCANDCVEVGEADLLMALSNLATNTRKKVDKARSENL